MKFDLNEDLAKRLLNFLDTKQWWLDSLTREYTIQFITLVEPILKDWEFETPNFLNKDNLNLNL